MKRIKVTLEVLVEATDETLFASSHKIEPNGLGQGQKLNSVFYFFPDSKIFGGNINAKDYSNKIISCKCTNSEVIRNEDKENETN